MKFTGTWHITEMDEWLLRAVHVRTNHVHAVVTAGSKPETILNAFIKANATREMRAAGCWPDEHTPWSKEAVVVTCGQSTTSSAR